MNSDTGKDLYDQFSANVEENSRNKQKSSKSEQGNIRDKGHYLTVFLKGLAMGAADVVPGVSGGTIAFISGIYDELLSSINSINITGIKKLFSQGPRAFWSHINGNFLASLGLGIAISIISFARIIGWALETHPLPLWSFFFGLVAASIFTVGRDFKKGATSLIMLVLGALFAYQLTVMPAFTDSEGLLFFFFSAIIAICAMILPGISGSYILLLLGAYAPIIAALNRRDLLIIIVFCSGCAIGLLAFSHFLKWLLTRHKNNTIAVLTGFLIGSLNKIWPWKEIVESKIINGKEKIILEKSIGPVMDEVGLALIFAFVGIAILLGLEYWAARQKKGAEKA